MIEGKEVHFPKNFSCDSCTLQIEWETKQGGRQYMCSDIQILNGKIEDCSGQCMHGGVCMNGQCDCRQGFSGKFCEVVDVVPDKTNYVLLLKYFLLFIVMILMIVIFIVLSMFIFKKLKEWKERQPDPEPIRPEPVIDEDDIMGSDIRRG